MPGVYTRCERWHHIAPLNSGSRTGCIECDAASADALICYGWSSNFAQTKKEAVPASPSLTKNAAAAASVSSGGSS